MTAKLREVVILVEGYDDRAFWAGLLTQRLGFTIAQGLSIQDKKRLGTAGRHLSKTSIGVKGHYTYVDPEFSCITRVVPCIEQHGIKKPLRYFLLKLLEGRETRSDLALAGVVVCEDDDSQVGKQKQRTPDKVRSWLPQAGYSGISNIEHGCVLPDGTRVLHLAWWAPDEDHVDIPQKQTLERVVCSAVGELWPERLQHVRTSADGRPEPTGAVHKVLAGTFWAGWHVDDGWSHFYYSLWKFPKLADALSARIDHDGALQAVLELLCGGHQDLASPQRR